jgi:Domain of unknown function (DUF6249)
MPALVSASVLNFILHPPAQGFKNFPETIAPPAKSQSTARPAYRRRQQKSANNQKKALNYMEDKVPLVSTVLALLIPIIAIIMGIGLGMLAIYLSYRKRKELFTCCHLERMAAIEKGIECPPWPDRLLADEDAPPSPRRHLLKGLVWLFIGLAASVAVYATVDFRRALFGLIPIGIGLAHLIYYFVEGRREAEAAEQTAVAPRT